MRSLKRALLKGTLAVLVLGVLAGMSDAGPLLNLLIG